GAASERVLCGCGGRLCEGELRSARSASHRCGDAGTQTRNELPAERGGAWRWTLSCRRPAAAHAGDVGVQLRRARQGGERSAARESLDAIEGSLACRPLTLPGSELP